MGDSWAEIVFGVVCCCVPILFGVVSCFLLTILFKVKCQASFVETLLCEVARGLYFQRRQCFFIGYIPCHVDVWWRVSPFKRFSCWRKKVAMKSIKKPRKKIKTCTRSRIVLITLRRKSDWQSLSHRIRHRMCESVFEMRFIYAYQKSTKFHFFGERRGRYHQNKSNRTTMRPLGIYLIG